MHDLIESYEQSLRQHEGYLRELCGRKRNATTIKLIALAEIECSEMRWTIKAMRDWEEIACRNTMNQSSEPR